MFRFTLQVKQDNGVKVLSFFNSKHLVPLKQSHTPSYLIYPSTAKMEVHGSDKKVICVLQCSIILLLIRKWSLPLTSIQVFIFDALDQKATYIERSFKLIISPPLEHLNYIRCGNKCELLLPACRFDDRRRHLHFYFLHPYPV